MCYGPVAGTVRMQVEEKNCTDANWLHPEAAAALWDSFMHTFSPGNDQGEGRPSATNFKSPLLLATHTFFSCLQWV